MQVGAGLGVCIQYLIHLAAGHHRDGLLVCWVQAAQHTRQRGARAGEIGGASGKDTWAAAADSGGTIPSV